MSISMYIYRPIVHMQHICNTVSLLVLPETLRSMGKETLFFEVHVAGHRKFGNFLLPTIITQNPSAELDHIRLTEAITTQKTWLDELLEASGAVLLRGFPIRTAVEFNSIVDAFRYGEFANVGGNAPRRQVASRVFTANEAPSEEKIHFHHELAQAPTFPSKIFFFCEEEPRSGGETPTYNTMKDKYPEFVAKLEQFGLIYVIILGEEDDPSSPIGRGWHSTFLTKDKSIAEERAAKLGMKLEWLENGVRIIMGPIPAIKYDETHGRKIWFNSMVAAYIGWNDSRNDPKKQVTFGDETPLPCEIVEDCLKVLDQESVAIPCKQGDVLLIDNLAVMHSRKSFEPPRRILASLCV